MYVFVISIDTDGSYYPYCRMKNSSTDPKAACMLAASEYLNHYVLDFGADFEEATLSVYPDGNVELRLTDNEGEPGRMYFTTDEAVYESLTHRRVS